MPVEHKPRTSKTSPRPLHKRRLVRPKPLLNHLPLLVAPELPLPSPITAEPVIAPPPVLIKTTYNRRRFWQIGGVMVVGVVLGLIYLAYTQRSYWLPFTTPLPARQAVYHLQVTPEKADKVKAQVILKAGQASASVNPTLTPGTKASDSTSIVPSAEVVATYTIDQLQSLLQQQINQLQQEKQDVRTLQSYIARAHNQPDQATRLLKEGVQLAREFQTLYLYYKK